MQIKTWLDKAKLIIKSDSPELDAEILLCEKLAKNLAYLRAFSDDEIDTNILKLLDDDLNKLANGYPISYIIGYREFWDMRLKVTADTLIPRQDTEIIIETLKQLYQSDDSFLVADLGTGTGAIAIAITREFTNASVIATDISKQALIVAKENASNWAKTVIEFRLTSWLDGFSSNYLDCIISNPPYIKEGDKHLESLKYEPITALTAKDDGLADIKIIIEQSAKPLKSNGILLLEHGYDQAEQVREIFSNIANDDYYWGNIKTVNDLGGNERITYAVYKTN